MTLTYIISQIFVILNYIFLISTYHTKDNKKIIIYDTVACTFSAIAFFLLKAYSGCAMSLIAIFRNFLFINKDNKNNLSFIIVLILLIGFSIYTYDGIFSLLPSLGTLLYTISIWQDDTKTYRVLGIPIEICWLSYHIYIFSLFGIILESILFISVIIGVVKGNTQ